jgi:hypothetical protein
VHDFQRRRAAPCRIVSESTVLLDVTFTTEMWTISINKRLVVFPALTHKLSVRKAVVQSDNSSCNATIVLALCLGADARIGVWQGSDFGEFDWLRRAWHNHQEPEWIGKQNGAKSSPTEDRLPSAPHLALPPIRPDSTNEMAHTWDLHREVAQKEDPSVNACGHFVTSNVKVTGTLRQGAARCTMFHGAVRRLAATCPSRPTS